jgi:hypothetical protein
MQTERVTFLTSRDYKKALDSFAAERGESVGSIVREATSRYIAQPRDETANETELAALTGELEKALPEMRDDFEAILSSLRSMNEKIEAYRAEKLRRKAA